jgi:integrase
MSFRIFSKHLKLPLDIYDDWIPPKPADGIAHPLDGGIDDVRTLLSTTNDDIERALIGLCGFAGLRIGEAITLATADYDDFEQDITIRGKGDKYRRVPVSNELKPIINSRIADSTATLFVPLTDHQARYVIQKLGKKAFGRKIASHDLRMTFGTELNDRGTNIRVTQELLGHASVLTTQRYTLVRKSQMREAVNF